MYKKSHLRLINQSLAYVLKLNEVFQSKIAFHVYLCKMLFLFSVWGDVQTVSKESNH